jgi:hypothetical protein
MTASNSKINQAGPARAYARTRKLTVVAQDPSVTVDGKILRALVEVPTEALQPGPRGYRVQVIDYDASTGKLYRPRVTRLDGDPFASASDAELLGNPAFHAQNAYAIVMRTLARFEYALGRRVSWSFSGHQLQIAPHAFADCNAFYSKRDRALLFGYFPARDSGMVFTSLSHDIVSHETAHALLDGLRPRYTAPSSPDQAAFHEGFADIVALLSVFSLPEVVGKMLDLDGERGSRYAISRKVLTPNRLRQTVLLGLAEQMGSELAAVRGNALRQSAMLRPSTSYMRDPAFEEPHERGEILVAAVMNAFLEVWCRRLKSAGEIEPGFVDRLRVVEDGADIAARLLTMAIRALDYAPPTDLEFCDFLSAMLTADREIQPDDTRHGIRAAILESFAHYGIRPTSLGDGGEPGVWERPEHELDYRCSHFESMQRDADEVFRFLWENRNALGLCEDAYTHVESVRPCLRIAEDGFALRETVAVYVQMIALNAGELAALGIEKPLEMNDDRKVTLYGGGALIFDEFGRLKFHVRNFVLNRERQTRRLRHLWKSGWFENGKPKAQSFAAIHLSRAVSSHG